MSYERFDRVFGVGLNPLQEHEFVTWLSKNLHVAYIDIDKLPSKIDPIWFAFVYKPPIYKECFVHFKDKYFRLEYIRKAVDALNPDEYNFLEAEYKPSGETDYLLILKKENHGIMVAPANHEYVDMEKVVNMDEIIKKTASDVFVI